MTLWTRLAPRDPLAIARAAVEVSWEVSSDDGFRSIAMRGKALAAPEWGHSIHVDVTGLQPGRPYWYRFRAGETASAVGRTRTAPRPDASDARMRFAFAACQQYEQGYYVAYRHMANEDLDLVIHLGDYIYESSWGRNHVRSHASDEPYTLADYRNRYALYKSDDDLQAAHAAFPWLVTWDDHEVDNDYANDRSQDLDPPEAFLARRAAAYQAYYEHMPLPAWARPSGPDMQLYAALPYGRLANFFVLDGRQYKSHQVCTRPGRGGSNVTRQEECAARLDPALTFLGSRQESWLYERLGASTAKWNVIAQQTLMAQTDRLAGDGIAYWSDGWDGYPRARERLLTAVSAPRVSNPLVLSGDVHMSAVTDLKVNFDDTKAADSRDRIRLSVDQLAGSVGGAHAAIRAGESAHQVRRRHAAGLLHCGADARALRRADKRGRKHHRPRFAAAQSRGLCGRKRPSRRGTCLISPGPESARGHAGRVWSDGL